MIELDELAALERDLTGVADLVPKKAGQAVQQTAMRTRNEWRKLAKGNPMGQQYTASIDYTLDESGIDGGVGVFEAEVGPNLARYGGKTGRGGLVPSMGFFDDPESTPVGVTPIRARRRAEVFADGELDKGIEIAARQSLAEKGLA